MGSRLRLGASLAILIVLGGARPETVRGGDDDAKPVVVLLEKQFLECPGGFPAFCKEHAQAKRSDLRRDTIASLKAIAAETQPAVLEALGSPKDAKSLWLVNALVVTLTPDAQAEAEALEGVKAVYPAGVVPETGDEDKVKKVLRPRKRRKAFSARRKQIPWHIEMLHVPEVWSELGFTGEGVLVAMYDQGVNYRHEDLQQNIWVNPGEKPNNRRDDDRNGLVDDYYGFDFTRWKAAVMDTSGPKHGTCTAGLVLGDGTGGTATGVAPRARFMSIVAFGGAYVATRAFQYMLEEGADVVNMSFSIPGLGQTRGLWRLMAEHATASGLVMVSGAGNFQKTAQIPVQIRIPEGIPCVICVGGVDRTMSVPGFVSLGPVEWASVDLYGDWPMPGGLIKPDVCAFPGPGLSLLSNGNDGYLSEKNTKHGNSFSAPHVAGVAALMLSAAPETTPWRVKEILEQTAEDLEEEGKDPRTGRGLVNALRAVQEAMKGGDE